MSNSPLPVALLGATGLVGQQFARLLESHPQFRITRLFASPRSAGRTYADATTWALDGAPPAALAGQTVEAATPAALAALPAEGITIAFSALDATVATDLESAAANAGCTVFSNAASHRMAEDVPLIVPEVNAEHLALAATQPRAGAIITNPNCSTIGLTMLLAPLARVFGLSRVSLVSLQACSGAGLKEGKLLDIGPNVIPFIGGEEEKLQTETHKILGTLKDTSGGLKIQPSDLPVSATCTRVPVPHGHTLCLSIQLDIEVSAPDIVGALTSFRARPQELALPSAPVQPIHHFNEPDFPQPALHANLEGGMAIATGRLRPDPIFGEPETQARRRGWKLVTLSHNLIRGAAGGSILNAELAHSLHLLET